MLVEFLSPIQVMLKMLPLIVAEVLATDVAQASKEFQCICGNPKLLSCRVGIQLMHRAHFLVLLQVDVLANIQDRELDNKAA